MINSGLKDLQEEIKKMSEAEIEIKDPESIVKIKLLKRSLILINKTNKDKV